MKKTRELKEPQQIETKAFKNTREINEYLHNEIKIKKRKPATIDIDRQDSVAVGLDEKVAVTINCDAGDFFGALNDGASIMLNGNAGRFAGDVMRSGKIVINGNCDEGAGMYMYGGQIIVNGNAGDNIGQMSKGGTILIKGKAGDFVGLYLTGGDIVILNASGKRTGDWMIRGRIFVSGNIASLGNNAVIRELNEEDNRFLANLFGENNIEFSLDKIKKVVPKELRPFYNGK